jgi:hypothetical protein
MLRVGVVGHRYLRVPWGEMFVVRHCKEILTRTRCGHSGVIALSALAVGADTHFARAALSLDIPLEVVRPFDSYAQDFNDPASRKIYRQLLRRARLETHMPYQCRSNEAYVAAMHWIVDQSDLLVAVWDGRDGITSDSVQLAVTRGSPWFRIDPVKRVVTFHA